MSRRYSITLNFFIPNIILNEVKKEKLKGKFIFDWRKKGYFHCTVKALELSNILDKKHLDYLLAKSKKVLSKQKPFKVIIKGVGRFPNVLYAKVYSKELKKLHNNLCKEKLPSNRPDFEGKNYHPHASLLFFEKPLKKTNITKNFGEFIVSEIQLVIWDIPNGHKPEIYHRFKLRS